VEFCDAYWFSEQTKDVPMATIAWGDGTSDVISVTSPNATPIDEPWTDEQIAQGIFPFRFMMRHTYLDDDPTVTRQDTYTITATVTDDDAGVDVDSEPLIVRNVDPTVTLGMVEVIDAVLSTDPVTGQNTYLNPGQLDESESFVIHGYVGDLGVLDTETVTLRVDLNFDGDTDDEGEKQSFPVAPNSEFSRTVGPVLDDGISGVPWPRNNTPLDLLDVSVEVADDDSGTGDGFVQVVVNNAAPRFIYDPGASNDGLDVSFGYDSLAEIISVTVQGTYDDPGGQDRHQLSVEWPDGSRGDGLTDPIDLAWGDSSFSVTRSLVVDSDDLSPLTITSLEPTFARTDFYPIRLTLTDDDAGGTLRR
jgi:hypothetical protein